MIKIILQRSILRQKMWHRVTYACGMQSLVGLTVTSGTAEQGQSWYHFDFNLQDWEYLVK